MAQTGAYGLSEAARRRWATVFLIAALATAALIFFFSAQEAADSQALSDGVTLQVAQVVRPDFNAMPEASRVSFLSALGATVRKCAHFLEFALLGFCLAGWLRLNWPERAGLWAGLWAWALATLYAGTDELHQVFVCQRGPGLLDVGIDSAGALTGVLALTLLFALIGALARRRVA